MSRSGQALGRVLFFVAIVLTQSIVWGSGVLRKLPLLIGGVVAAMYGVFVIRDWSIRRRRPGDAELTVSASLMVDSVHTGANDEISEALRNIRPILTRVVGQGAATGFLDVTEPGVRWRPGPVSRLWRYKSFVVNWDDLKDVKVSANYPGLGRLAATLRLETLQGAMLEFWTRDHARLRDSLARKSPRLRPR